MSEKIKLPIIVGPTAGGKSALALRVAEEVGGEIVSCDSMQIYRRMDIGTAKPTEKEQARVPHHMIDIVEPWEAFSCADYAIRARAVIEDILARGRVPIVCGGTGLYLEALLRGGMCAMADSDPAYRQELEALAEERGNGYIHRLLAQIDPESAEAIHMNNRKRVIRALEIFRVSGRRKSDLDRENNRLDGVFEPLAVGLLYADRNVLYRRIEERVDAMLAGGLMEEVGALLAEGVFDRSPTALGAIGYKELLGYLRGECSLEEAACTLKLATRHYAKRQLTWFGAKSYVTPLEISRALEQETFEKIVKKTKKVFQFE